MNWARWVGIAALALIALAGAGAYFVYQTGSGAVAHLDPTTATPKSTPNWALALPKGSETAQFKTHETPLFEASPLGVIDAFEAFALSEPRVARVDDGSDPLWRSYVQRSRILRFPDYISVKAVELQTADGPRASLIVYSRSVYGYSDLGVNGKRMVRWLVGTAEVLAKR